MDLSKLSVMLVQVFTPCQSHKEPSSTYERSLMDLTLQENGVEPWLLDTQYRMHPAIAEFPNLLFYDGKLKSGITAADRPAPRGKPPAASVSPSVSPSISPARQHRGNAEPDGQASL